MSKDKRFQYAVFDLKKNIYTAKRIPGLDAKVCFKKRFFIIDLLLFTVYLAAKSRLKYRLSIPRSVKIPETTIIPLCCSLLAKWKWI